MLGARRPRAAHEVALLGYSYGNLEPMREMLLHPNAALGLSRRRRALRRHLRRVSIPTFMLTHWARDRDRGERLPLELVVRKQTHDTAALYGLGDRGVRGARVPRRPQRDRLRRAVARSCPRWSTTCPAAPAGWSSGRDGYRSTFVAGEEIMHDGEETGARPGKLVRGMR